MKLPATNIRANKWGEIYTIKSVKSWEPKILKGIVRDDLRYQKEDIPFTQTWIFSVVPFGFFDTSIPEHALAQLDDNAINIPWIFTDERIEEMRNQIIDGTIT